MSAVVAVVLFLGVLTEPLGPLAEAMATSMVLKHELEKHHRKGEAAVRWRDLGADDESFGGYYPSSLISWQSKFDEQGRFCGVIHFAGDPVRNLPSCDVTFSDRGRPIGKLASYRSYLPILKKEYD
jgi:hypothetical protein